MTELLLLKGPPALSEFRLAKMRQRLGVADGALYAEFLHLLCLEAPLDQGEEARIRSLLQYGPESDRPDCAGELAFTVVPRLGTISPWSSKATDIFRTCGLGKVIRVERGIRWYLDPEAAGRLDPAPLFDRMTQRVVPEGQLAGVRSMLDGLGYSLRVLGEGVDPGPVYNYLALSRE